MPVEAQPLDDQAVEMAGEEIGQVEGAGLLVMEGVEGLEAGIEGVAMRAGESLDAFLGKHPVERAAGAAIGIGAEDRAPERAERRDLAADRIGDELRAVMEMRRQAGELDAGKTVPLGDEAQLAGQRPAGNDDEGRFTSPLIPAKAGTQDSPEASPPLKSASPLSRG